MTRGPVIILGMHRSGTSLIARVLERLGLFAGRRKEHNHEAWLLLKLNDWLLAQCAARWDHPAPFDLLLDAPDVRARTARYLDDLLGSPRAISYLGWRRWLRYRHPRRLPRPWGWKDPRTTFTLPLWRDVFPEARIIHVRRHGVDVAASLMTRRVDGFRAACAKYDRFGRWYWLRPKDGGFADSLRLHGLDDAFGLWEQYTDRAAEHTRAMGERAIELRYEDFLRDPAPHAGRLASFCGLDAGGRAVAEAVADVRADRAFAFADDGDLAAFAGAVAGRLAARGYAEIGGP
ncbi:MAG: sulfotransferase [Planctomycetes bacterium]|nr:sulfotransferase [Planctomycetota bacterium]